MSSDDPLPDGGAMAMAGLGLMLGLMRLLKEKGILTEAEIIEMIDSQELTLEEMGTAGRNARDVHGILEALRSVVSGLPPPSTHK